MRNFDGSSHQDISLNTDHDVLFDESPKDVAIKKANKIFYDWIYKAVSTTIEEQWYGDKKEQRKRLKRLNKKFKLSDITKYKESYFIDLYGEHDGLPCIYAKGGFASLHVYEWTLDKNNVKKKKLIHSLPK